MLDSKKNCLAAGLLAMTTTVFAMPVYAQEPKAAEPFTCAAVPEPVVSLSIGSRYQADSATRSEISEESNEDVNKALEPVETFINDLSAMANSAYLGGPDSQKTADCVMGWLSAWAEADALSELNSLNARLAISPRLAGLALAFLQAKDSATPDAARDERIAKWFDQQASSVVEFFATEAGPLASTNNLRAWAALATASIARITGNTETLAWARESYELLVCGAETSGALPSEMKRGERALHYQLHALAPLVVAVGLLETGEAADEELCNPKLNTIVEFTLAALENPQIVADLVGADQVFSGDDETEPASYQLAWAEAYLAQWNNAALEAYVAPLRPLKYSKLGGNLTEIYSGKQAYLPQEKVPLVSSRD